MQKIIRDESANAARREATGHKPAAKMHQNTADEAREMLRNGHYGRNSHKHVWR
ncbi:hypothetical protein [Streptosporangium sp. KLBMP 9127]|nr:hypothetical protein [Streptosporangium sp. KLBMP 9127]